MFNRILVPTDVSEFSRKALLAALELAKEFNSEVELFHVTTNPEFYWATQVSYGTYIPVERLEQVGQAALEETLKGIDVSGVRLLKKKTIGYPATEIVDESRKGFDLIVMGKHGYGLLKGAIIGSVTNRVLAEADCPVLVIK